MAFSCAYLLRKIQESSLENGVSTNLIDKKSKSPEDVSPIISEILNNLITDVCLSEVDVDRAYDEQSKKSDIFINPDIDLLKENVDNDESFTNSKETCDDLDCEIIYEDKNSYDEQFDFTQPPYQLTGAWSEFESDRINNYTRGCKWAPDGSCILTCSEDNILRIFNLPEELWDSSKWQDICEMESVLKISEGEIIYDFCWYPLMNSTDPCTCCFASCSKNSTVHLWDAFTGQLRCSYRTYDQVDEITAARSLSFESDGGRIFCGFEKYIRVFNINLPGRLYEERKVFDKKSGQPGIISCFAFTSANTSVSAAGSYQKTIGIYSEPDGNLEFVLEGQKGGVTHLQFSPNGNLLFSGGRKDLDILCWDIRNLSQVLYCMRRCCLTNQRMYFDITRAGRYVISGNTNGIITIWDTQKETKSINNSLNILEPVQCYMGHNDCVNGISIHPTFPLLCSSSGQRKFPELLSDDEEEMFTSKTIKSDNSLRLWWIGKNS